MTIEIMKREKIENLSRNVIRALDNPLDMSEERKKNQAEMVLRFHA